MPVILRVAEQQAEQAAFLWLLRERAVLSSRYTLSDLTRLDRRIDAHLEGLVLAGDGGWAVCAAALQQPDAGELFTAAAVALRSGNLQHIQQVLERGAAAKHLVRGVVSAFGWQSFEAVEGLARSLITAELPAVRRIGTAVFAIHRRNPGPLLLRGGYEGDSHLRTRLLRAIGELGRLDDLQPLRDNLSSPDEGCRFAAAWSAAVLGDARALPVLKSVALSASPLAPEAAEMIIRGADVPTALDFQQELARRKDLLRAAVICAGVLGVPAVIPWLLEQMPVAGLARVAGEAFATLTGADLKREHLDAGMPDGFRPGPTDNPDDDDVEIDEDDGLSWPSPARVADWWAKHGSTFTNGNRYFRGKPIQADWLGNVLQNGRQQHRTGAALELAIRHPGRPLFNTRAPGFRQ